MRYNNYNYVQIGGVCMNAVQPTKSEVAAKFASGLHCAQCSLCPWAEELGYDEEELCRMAGAFGGGMSRGDTCGAVTGSLIALGLALGGGPETRALIREKTEAFQRAFTERFGSTICRELIGYDFSVPEDGAKAAESGIVMDLCPQLVCGAVEILNGILADE